MAGTVTSGRKIQAFLQYCRTEKGLALNSLDAYRRDLARLVSWLGTGPLASVSLDTLRRYLDYLRHENLSNRSIARHVAALRAFFGFLLEEGEITANPAELLTAPKIGSSLPKYLNAASVDQLIGSPSENSATGLRDHAMLDLLYATGLRVSELIKLRVADLDELAGTLRVIGKGNKQRLVPIGRQALRSV